MSTASTRPIRASCPRRAGSTKISFEEMLEMASLGAKVLQVRSVELAMVHKVRTFVRSSFDDPDAPGMGDARNPPGTLICDEEEIVEQQVVTGIAYAKDEAQISLRRVADRPGVAAAIFGPLAEANINVDMIVQNISEDGTTHRHDLHRAVRRCRARRWQCSKASRRRRSASTSSSIDDGMSKVSVDRHRHAQPCRRRGRARSRRLPSSGINIRAITTSEIKISILIDGPIPNLRCGLCIPSTDWISSRSRAD